MSEKPSISDMHIAADFVAVTTPRAGRVLHDAIDELAASRERIAELEALTESDDDLAGWQAMLDQRDALRAELERVKTEHGKYADNFRAVIQDLEEQIRQAVRERDEARAEIAAWHKQSKDWEMRVDREYRQRQDVAAERDALRAELAKSEAEMNELVLEIGYGERPEGQDVVQRASGPYMAERFRDPAALAVDVAKHIHTLANQRADRAEAACAAMRAAFRERWVCECECEGPGPCARCKALEVAFQTSVGDGWISSTEAERLRAALKSIEERTRPDGDMADQAVNALARAALARDGETSDE